METYLPAVLAILRGSSDVSLLVGACDAGMPLPVPSGAAPFGGDREEERPAGVKEVMEGESWTAASSYYQYSIPRTHNHAVPCTRTPPARAAPCKSPVIAGKLEGMPD